LAGFSSLIKGLSRDDSHRPPIPSSPQKQTLTMTPPSTVRGPTRRLSHRPGWPCQRHDEQRNSSWKQSHHRSARGFQDARQRLPATQTFLCPSAACNITLRPRSHVHQPPGLRCVRLYVHAPLNPVLYPLHTASTRTADLVCRSPFRTVLLVRARWRELSTPFSCVYSFGVVLRGPNSGR
jgi:hypothetical protein